MKKLKEYKKVDFHFVEVQMEGSACEVPKSKEIVTPEVGGGGDLPPVEEFDAPIFRGGIWDED